MPDVSEVTRSYRVHGGGILRETVRDGVEVFLDGAKFIKFGVALAGEPSYVYIPMALVSLQLPDEPRDRSVVLSAKNEAWQRSGAAWYHRTTAASWEVLNRTEGPLKVLYSA